MTEFRRPTEEQRDQVVDVMRVSLDLDPSFVEFRGPHIALDQFRCATEHDRVIAVAAGRPYSQRWGGRDVPMIGIWGVGTLPERRGSGLASGAVGQLMHEAREAGTPLSALYPAILRPYRGLGYELAGTFMEHHVRLDDLPRGGSGPLPVEEYAADRDLDAVRACYRRVVENDNGPIDSEEPFWWERVMGRRSPNEHLRAVVARAPDGGVAGYASFVHEKEEGGDIPGIAFRLSCRHLISSSLEATASLLGYFRGFRGLGNRLRFTGPPSHPLAMLVEEQRVKPAWIFRWMLRLLDVPAALVARGYPPVSGEAVIAVEDGMFPANRGPWRIGAKEGSVEVAPVDDARVRPIPVGTLAAMYSGFLSPFDAARLGLVDDDDPAIPLLARLFAGPPAFMYDFF